MTTFSHTIASASPLEASRKPHCLVCRLGSRQSQRISELVDSVQLTQTSALTGFRPVPRVRILPAPPRSLDCREIPLALRRNTRIMPVFRDYSQANRTGENGLLGIECGSVLVFSGGHMRSPVSTRALGECNAITSPARSFVSPLGAFGGARPGFRKTPRGTIFNDGAAPPPAPAAAARGGAKGLPGRGPDQTMIIWAARRRPRREEG